MPLSPGRGSKGLNILRVLILTCLAAVIAGAAYVASPLVAAWTLREAIRTNDVAAIRDKVDWPRVRLTLRQSLANEADILPVRLGANRPARRTLWQSVKAMFARPMIDRFLDRYITPEGLPKLFEARTAYRTHVRGEVPDSERLWQDRLRTFVQRIRRAEFTEFGTFALELRDKYKPERVYLSVFQREGLIGWKLVTLRILKAEPSEPAGLMARL